MNTCKPIGVALALLAGVYLAPASLAQEEGFKAITAADIQWMPAPSVGPGAMLAVLEGDPKTAEPFTMRLKLPPNSTIGVHTHPVTERVTVISGTFYFGVGDKFDPDQAKAYQPGDTLIIPSGVAMYAASRDQETVLQLHGSGPWGISYLDPADDPRNQ
ncbi:hypothetical protein N878_16290 [Pseudomonas sp. EGD-AK9]|uniref:cupin domain-containing protein n=1 Tax=Pseudomonas sp. EGD-AK9 TaxID=1386078 RepID=UPI00039828F4|nr:cupin domain-containing protein [Pseudomonas sp. EGD-AK9]ERI53214.1 hypothetical protein N878_16290 [Pseudomonas sp. EGD-AK9]